MSILKVRLNKLSSDWQIARAVLEDEYKEYLAKALDRIRTRYEFASHLLDVHRMWCAECPHSGCPAQPVRSDRDTCAAESASGEPGFQLAAARDMSIHAGLLDNSSEDNIEDYKISGTALPLEVACNDEDGENQTVTLNDKVIKQEHCDDNNSQENFKNEKQREEGSEASFLYQIPHSHIPDVLPQLDWTNNVSDIHILIKQEESSQECYDIVMEGSKNRTELHQGHEEDRKTNLGNSEPPRSSCEHGSEAFIQAQSGAGIDEPSKSTHDMTGHSPEEAAQDQGNTDGKIFLEIENKSGPSRFTFNTKHSPEASVQVQCDASIGEPLSSAHGINRQSSEDSVQDQCNTGDSSSNIVQHHSKGQSSNGEIILEDNSEPYRSHYVTKGHPLASIQALCDGSMGEASSSADERNGHSLEDIEPFRLSSKCGPEACDVGLGKPLSSAHDGNEQSHEDSSLDLCDAGNPSKNKVEESLPSVYHSTRNTGDNLYQCSVCLRFFRSKSYLTVHMRTHTGQKPYQCSFCNKAFTRKDSLTLHMKTHTGEKPYQCSFCNKAFKRKIHLTLHMRRHTGEKPCECSVCRKAFSDGSSLSRHRRTHTGDKPYQCSLCHKSFFDSSTLTTHKKTHTGDKPYRCSICNKSFSLSSSLPRHMRLHTDEKPYDCSICNKSFSDSRYLTNHMRTHTGEKPYDCSLCHKSFSDSSNLTTHMRTHTGDKPYKCSVCNKAFTQSSNLSRHMTTHTGQKP